MPELVSHRSRRTARRIASCLATSSLVVASALAAEPLTRRAPAALAEREGAPVVVTPDPATEGSTVTGPRTLIADSRTVRETERPVTAADEEAAITREINAKQGTYQSYLLYTSPDLPERLFHPGFTFTLGPPRRSRLELLRESGSVSPTRAAPVPASPASPAGPRP